ncbi:unnamed protein product, partial [Ectocarpus sp. 13 AM-2016]
MGNQRNHARTYQTPAQMIGACFHSAAGASQRYQHHRVVQERRARTPSPTNHKQRSVVSQGYDALTAKKTPTTSLARTHEGTGLSNRSCDLSATLVSAIITTSVERGLAFAGRRVNDHTG